MRKFVLFFILFSLSPQFLCWASNLESKKLLKGINSLGGNQDLYENLKKLYSKDKGIYVVQKRNNPRVNRFEFGLVSQYGYSTYLQFLSLGFYSQYHLNPYWSFFVNLKPYLNKLTKEGEYSLKEGLRLWDKGEDLNFIPELNWPIWSSSAGVSFYPFYGKISLFKSHVIYFDTYFSVGTGLLELRRQKKLAYCFETGFSFWISKYLSLRSFVNWQAYKQRPKSSVKESEKQADQDQRRLKGWIDQYYLGLSVGLFI